MIQNLIQQPNLCNIKVAVRVRPFNQRDEVIESKPCILMNNSEVEVETQDIKTKFVYDYCLWSDDDAQQFNEQYKVLNNFGDDLLKSASEGYNTCLIAYGETGAGKSYSLFGSKSQAGIVNRFCDDLFKHIDSSGITHQVKISILEIESEGLFDRLIPDQRFSQELQLKEAPNLSLYIPNITKYLVKNYYELKSKIDLGINNQKRSNFTIGRHTWGSTLIIQLELTQIVNNKHRVSMIQFVDMAGSEMIKQPSGKLKLRNITNALKNVITTLTDKDCEHIPYRDSKLTRILQHALGGNCKTYMICVISPSSLKIKGSILTLKLADRARKVVNKVSLYSFQADQLIDTQYSELVSLKSDINLLLQQLVKKNENSSDIICQHFYSIEYFILIRYILIQLLICQLHSQVKSMYFLLLFGNIMEFQLKFEIYFNYNNCF